MLTATEETSDCAIPGPTFLSPVIFKYFSSHERAEKPGVWCCRSWPKILPQSISSQEHKKTLPIYHILCPAFKECAKLRIHSETSCLQLAGAERTTTVQCKASSEKRGKYLISMKPLTSLAPCTHHMSSPPAAAAHFDNGSILPLTLLSISPGCGFPQCTSHCMHHLPFLNPLL